LYKPLSVSGYQRLLDFNAGVGDTGPSQLSGNLLAYPIAAGTGAALISTTALQLNRIDSNVTKLVTARINGTRVLQFTDTGDVYRIAATSLRFFKDNTSGGAKITGAASGPKVIYRGQ